MVQANNQDEVLEAKQESAKGWGDADDSLEDIDSPKSGIQSENGEQVENGEESDGE